MCSDRFYFLIQHLIFLFILTLTAKSQRKQFYIRYIPVNEWGIKNQWDNVDKMLTQNNCTAISIDQNVVTIEGLRKLFSQNMKYVTSFSIRNTIVNKQIMDYLWTIEKIYELEELALSKNNIYDEDFETIKVREMKLKALTLTENTIGAKGFKYLSKLKMPLLQKLNLAFTSLIDDQAVDTIISLGLQKIQSLTLDATGISDQNMIKVLKAMNTDKIKSLSLAMNKLTRQFYKEFSKFSFDSLTNLNFNSMEIDEDDFQWLQNMKFPSLVTLMLYNNQLTNEEGRKFITKQNMPKLQDLYLDGNFINSTFFQHLKQEGFALKTLASQINKIDNDAFRQLANMNLSRFQRLQFRTRTVNPEWTRNFLNSVDPKTIKYINIEGNINANQYLPILFGTRWEQLEIILFEYIEQFDINGIAQEIFPQLKVINLVFRSLVDQDILIYLVKNIQKIAPKLMRIDLNIMNAGGFLLQIFEGRLNSSLTQQLHVYITYQIPKSTVLRFIFDPVKKPKITWLDFEPAFIAYVMGKLAKGEVTEASLSYPFTINILYNTFQKNLHKNFDFSRLQILLQSPQLSFMKKIIMDTGRKCVLPLLHNLVVPISDETDLSMIKYCQFPSLITFRMFNVGLTQGKQFISFNFATNKFPHLTALALNMEVNKDNLKSFFKKNPLKYFLALMLGQVTNLQALDLIQIQNSIPHFHRLLAVDYSHAFINNDLTFLTKTGIQPRTLNLNNIIFSPGVLVQLCAINFQFLQNLQISNAGIDDQYLLSLLQCIEKKYNRRLHFPQLKIIDLHNNFIGTEGFSKLLKMGSPQLVSLDFSGNIDYQLFNSIFSSPWSRLLSTFSIDLPKFYGIDPSINPKNVRRLESLVIKSSSLADTDIEALSQLQFYSITKIGLVVRKISNCKFLEYLLHLSKNTISFELMILDSPYLNSLCLKNNAQDFSEVTPQTLFLLTSEYLGEMKYFIERMLNKNSVLKYLYFLNTVVPNEKLIEMIETSDLSNLEQFVITNCEVSDEVVKKLFKKKLPKLRKIMFIRTNLTAQALSTMQNINFEKLEDLVLQNNPIGDKGLNYLITNQFPILTNIRICNTDITRQGIKTLSKLQAPLLLMIDISSNGFTFEDYTYFNNRPFSQLREYRLYPSLGITQKQKLEQLFRKNSVQPNLKFEILTSVVDVMEAILQEDVYYDEDQQFDQEIN